jgi:hypothetical protein
MIGFNESKLSKLISKFEPLPSRLFICIEYKKKKLLILEEIETLASFRDVLKRTLGELRRSPRPFWTVLLTEIEIEIIIQSTRTNIDLQVGASHPPESSTTTTAPDLDPLDSDANSSRASSPKSTKSKKKIAKSNKAKLKFRKHSRVTTPSLSEPNVPSIQTSRAASEESVVINANVPITTNFLFPSQASSTVTIQNEQSEAGQPSPTNNNQPLIETQEINVPLHANSGGIQIIAHHLPADGIPGTLNINVNIHYSFPQGQQGHTHSQPESGDTI